MKHLRSAEEVVVKYPLASELNAILGADPSSELSADSIVSVLTNAKLLFQCQGDTRRMILQLSDTVVVKIVSASKNDGREYAALEYLRDQLPGLSVPQPLGEIQIKKRSMMFMSYIPGEELEKVWPSLNHVQKKSLVGELETFISSLRSLWPPEGQRYGGCGGRLCILDLMLDRIKQNGVVVACGSISGYNSSEPTVLKSEQPPLMQNLD